MNRVNQPHSSTALGALLLIAFASGCADKSSTNRSTADAQSTSADPSFEDANVETLSSSEPIVITGMNVAGECYEGCSKRIFKAIATLSDGNKVAFTKANYRKIGAIGEPEWKFAGDNVLCVKEADAAFAPICSSTNGKPVTVGVSLKVKTTKFPKGIEAPTLTATITPDQQQPGGTSEKKLYLFVTYSSFRGNMLFGSALGVAGGDYACGQALSSPLNGSFGHIVPTFAILSSSQLPLAERIQLTTTINPVQEESSNSVKFSRPIYSFSGVGSTAQETLLIPAGMDLFAGLNQRAASLISVQTIEPLLDGVTIRIMQGCSDWTSLQPSSFSDSINVLPMASGGGATYNFLTGCNQPTAILCLAVDP